MTRLLLLALPLFGLACRSEGTTKYIPDRDEDGFNEDEDCDDNDASVGQADTYYYDGDLDGHGDAAAADGFCDRPEGYSEVGDDCDDTDSAVYPGALDLCDDLDNDCDGVVDNGLESTAFYADLDGDGYGDDGSVIYDCTQPEGAVVAGGDCDDGDAAYNPGALEEDCEDPNDYNCDGSVGFADTDADGFAACAECDDGNAAVNPDATEVCNGADDDCDSLIDDDDDSLDPSSGTTVYADLDGDGFGDPASPALMCEAGPGFVADASDCDDTRADVNPAATEVCNGLDDDCDTLVDDADDSLDSTTGTAWYTDADGDGYGDSSATTLACDAPVAGVAIGGDCNDADAAYNPGASESDCADPNDYNCDGSVGYADGDGDGFAACEECDDTSAANFPGATELCDGADNDCDGTVDEPDAADASVWYADTDGDTYGDPATATTACDAPSGYVADATDCDDAAAGVNPAEIELCNGIDDNCDGVVDEDTAADSAAWYADSDGDGFGDAGDTLVSCSAPAGYVADATDCDDTTSAVNPDAIESCNGVDDNCDGAVDEDGAIDAAIWYADADGDTYGEASVSAVDCDQPAGYVADATDCDDAAGAVNPGASEVCNGTDDDCDTAVDEGVTATYYADSDGDTYGDSASTIADCSAPAGYVSNDDDCDDSAASVNPAAAEVCNGVDDDCDGALDEGVTTPYYADTDSDGYGDLSVTTEDCGAPAGYVADSTDCDDADAAVNPAAIEACNGYDDDCDSAVDEGVTTTYYADADGDGYGDSSATTADCSAPVGYVSNATDCDDTLYTVNPAATEVCNTLDDDCDGATDGADSWWDTAWPYRIPVTLTAASTDVSGPPVAIEVDFAAASAALGGGTFSADTVRVVLQDCSLGQPELPSQFEDDIAGLFEKQTSTDTSGDGFGTVLFLYDENGDYASLDAFLASSTASIAIYFGGSAAAPAYSTDLAATASTLETDLTVNTFDATQGGLLDSMYWGGSPNLQSQTDSCCGNSIYSASWGVDPQDGAGTLTLLDDGPVFASVQATGSRSDAQSSYDYTETYWMFAGRPELWNKVYQVTTSPSTLSHGGDYTSGIRPWEARRDAISSGATFTTDTAYAYADVSNGTWGVAWGYYQEPTYLVTLSNYDPYIIAVGNDYAPYGSGTPGSLPTGTAYMDNEVQLIYPHATSFSTAVQDEFFGLLEGVSVAQGTAEAQ